MRKLSRLILTSGNSLWKHARAHSLTRHIQIPLIAVVVASEAQPSTEKAETEPTVEDTGASLPASESQTTESSGSEDPRPTAVPGASLQTSTALQAPTVSEKKAPRKLIDEEKRAVVEHFGSLYCGANQVLLLSR